MALPDLAMPCRPRIFGIFEVVTGGWRYASLHKIPPSALVTVPKFLVRSGCDSLLASRDQVEK